MILVPFAALFAPRRWRQEWRRTSKHDNQLFTYRAIEAFMRGEDPNVASEANRKWPPRGGKLVAKTLIAAAIGFCCGWGLTSIVQKLLA